MLRPLHLRRIAPSRRRMVAEEWTFGRTFLLWKFGK